MKWQNTWKKRAGWSDKADGSFWNRNPGFRGQSGPGRICGESIPGSRGFEAGQRHHSSPGLELDLQKGPGDLEGTGDRGNRGSG